MSHRTALTLSVALTLILAIGILLGRDRFFAAEANAGTVATSAPAISGASLPRISGANNDVSGPRVIEIPLPAAGQGDTLRQGGDAERSARGSSERDGYGGEAERDYDD